MLIGLDVGGTYTDGALIDESLWRSGAEAASSGALRRAIKAPTRRSSVLPGILEALDRLLEGEDPAAVRRVCVSSTLGLNALLTGKEDPTGVLAVPGPGVNPRLFWGEDPFLHILSGALDHRGTVVARLDAEESRQRLYEMKSQGARACAVVSKFSPKNSVLERELRSLALEVLGADTPVVCGAEISGTLNFPRRMQTAYCNASLSRIGKAFAKDLMSAVRAKGLTCPVVILKADAGVFSIMESSRTPAESMGSGPAASLMGILALLAPDRGGHSGVSAQSSGDLLMIDMGGTTTDLALLADGHPLLEREGLNIAGRSTLIRGLLTLSIALGGDSVLAVAQDGSLIIGPDRQGPAIAFFPEDLGKRPPTFTDALNVLGRSELGDVEVSRKAMRRLAGYAQWEPEQGDAAEDRGLSLSRAFANAALERIRNEAARLVSDVNARPVYTIRELLVEKELAPHTAVFLGGPARAMAALAREQWDMDVVVPYAAECANAVGAALARPTRMADLYADTLRGKMTISPLGIEEAISKDYSLEQAKTGLVEALSGVGRQDIPAGFGGLRAENVPEDAFGGDSAEGGAHGHMGNHDLPRAQIVFAESFQVLDERQGRGRIIKARAQMPAGLGV